MTTPDKLDPILHTITVLIVDDYPIWRQGLHHVLAEAESIQVVAEVASGVTALQLARELRPDIVLLDINLPDMSGLQVAARLKEENNRAAVIVLTSFDDDTQAFLAMQAGCAAYCAKAITPDRLITTIQLVMDGYYSIRGQLFDAYQIDEWLKSHIEMMIGNTYIVQDEGQFEMLSPREMQILEHIAEGLSNREISQQLAISYQTVKNHVSSILLKLGVEDRIQAALFALRRGWVRLSVPMD